MSDLRSPLTRSVLLLAACNHAPSEWPDGSISPGGDAPWGYPTEIGCDAMVDPEAFEVDGFTFCGRGDSRDKVAVDDPILVPCDLASEPTVIGRLLSVFDGVHARGYSIDKLAGREIVNDDWFGEPLLVDY